MVPWKDNTQKIFILSSDLVIGFAGDIDFAGSIIGFLADQIKERPLLSKLNVFYQKGPKLIKYAYDVLSKKAGEKRSVGFIVASLDPARPEPIKDKDGQVIGHMGVYEKKLFKISFPGGHFKKAGSVLDSSLIIGSGEDAIKGKEESFRNLQFASNIKGALNFHAFIMDISLRKRIKELGIDTVGGLSQIVTIDFEGARFLLYQGKSDLGDTKDELDIELIIKDHRLVQRNLITGKEIPLLFPTEVIKIKDPESELFADLDDLAHL